MNDKKVVPLPGPFLESRISDKSDPAPAQEIVDAFARYASEKGIRSISMAELARELRVSTKTLYKYFQNKGELVHEMIVKWEKRIHKPIETYGSDLVETLRYWVKVWVENDARFSTAFWTDLKSDYPQLYRVYVDSLYNRMAAMKLRLTPFLKEEVNHDFAWSSYFILMTASSQPKTFEKIGMTREQCVFEAFNFWMNGAVDMAALGEAQKSENLAG